MQVKYDRKLLIAIGRSRKASQWQNREMLWSELLDKLAQTTRTRETAAEYAALPKGDRDTIKDVGGFVGGYLKNGRRSNASVVNRCLVCLDADYADEGLLDDLDLTFINAYALYSTHSHTPEKMRLRLIIPLSRTVTPDEYAAVSRRIADELTLTRFDPTTFEPARLMYWPSTPEDGEFVFRYNDAPFLDPDAVLATYPDWTDASLWPTTRPLEERTRAKIGKQEDPLEKKGVIGAFCRAHSITDVLEHVLSDRYTPTEQEDRYTFIGGSTTGGLVVYDDKYAYSHHATDPAGGKLCNAFDLVRLHLFTPGGTAPDGSLVGDEADSVSAMRAYAAADEATCVQLTEERLRQAEKDFSEEPSTSAVSAVASAVSGTAASDTAYAAASAVSDNASTASGAAPENASTPAVSDTTIVAPPAWQSKLKYDKMGAIKNTLTNLLLIMQNDPQLKGVVFNQLSDGMEIRDDIAPVPWKHPSKFWRDADDKQIISYIETRYGAFSNRNYDVAIGKVTDDRSYHPIRDYLSSLPEWDRTPRIETLLIDYLGAPDNRYVRAVTRKTLCAAVKRVLQPGIKFDTMLVLNGPQGVGKSTLIAKLGGEWFNDSLSLNDTKDKTAAEKLQGFWIMEIGELAGLRKAEVETLRSFLSRQNDIYRASFGKRATPHLRQCVFFGTTNEESGYLRDTTGNRRFWPVKTPGTGYKHSWQLTREEIDQIWAEALYYVNSGEKIYLDSDLDALAQEEQREAMQTDEREGLVREYLDKLLPEDWETMDLAERRGFLRGDAFTGGNRVGTVRRNTVCALEIWCECLGRESGAIRRSDSNDIFSMLARIGWKKAETNSLGVRRLPLYGPQRCFDRPEA